MGEVDTGQYILFSFCRRLQNHTRTTSFSMDSCSEMSVISSEFGFGLSKKRFSSVSLMFVSMLVLFFLFRP